MRSSQVLEARLKSKVVEWYIISLQRILSDLPKFEAGRGTLDVIINQLEIVYRELAGLEAIGGLGNVSSTLVLVG